MTLQDFIRAARERLYEFEDKYLEHHREEPDDWPLELDEEEWWDQLMAHLGLTP